MVVLKKQDDHALPYKLVSLTSGRATRFLVQKKKGLETSVAMSIYEAYLSKKYTSPNTIRKALTSLRYFYSFSDEAEFNVEETFLSGNAIPTEVIRGFAYWLSLRVSKKVGCISNGYYNDILLHCKQASQWFIQQFGAFSASTTIERKMVIQNAIAADSHDWKMAKKKVYQAPIAADLEDSEVSALERFFDPKQKHHKNRSEAVVFRNYVIWRLAIEMGLRRGEILALRLVDCPSRHQPFVKVVRIEERGFDYTDPRGAKAPRPKTLSRDLGFVLYDSPLPILINTYITRYRLIDKVRHGRKTGRKTMPLHDFLFISHRDGKPLSYDSLEDIAKRAKRCAKVPRFHWHLARHAFFNRAFQAAMNDEQSDTRLKDLVQFGGWSDEASLDIYSRRARRDRSREALIFWQSGKSSWRALGKV